MSIETYQLIQHIINMFWLAIRPL